VPVWVARSQVAVFAQSVFFDVKFVAYGALEDTDDTTTGISGGAVSFRTTHFFSSNRLPRHQSLRSLKESRAKKGVGEVAAEAAAQACKHCLLREKLLLLLLLQLCAALLLQQSQNSNPN